MDQTAESNVTDAQAKKPKLIRVYNMAMPCHDNQNTTVQWRGSRCRKSSGVRLAVAYTRTSTLPLSTTWAPNGPRMQFLGNPPELYRKLGLTACPSGCTHIWRSGFRSWVPGILLTSEHDSFKRTTNHGTIAPLAKYIVHGNVQRINQVFLQYHQNISAKSHAIDLKQLARK